jgi:peptidyl-prolyl cis-trans isomerase A (cyclophilin A)
MLKRLLPIGLLLCVISTGCKDSPAEPDVKKDTSGGAATTATERRIAPPNGNPGSPGAEPNGAPVKIEPDPPTNAKLLKPEAATEKAPATFKAKFETSKGEFVVEIHRDWSPNGADRFYNLIKLGYYNHTRFFRVVDGFMVQWGIHGDPAVNPKWSSATIQDDKVKESNKRGFITFAKTGMPNSRTTQVFINFKDNGRLDGMGFSPFGKIIKGMDIVDSLYKGYGEGAPQGRGPSQGRLQAEGNAYLKKDFPKMDWIKSTSIVP